MTDPANPVVNLNSAAIASLGNADTAFGWGDHASAGYNSGYQEATHREDNEVLFTGDYITGINAAARTGNITFNFTGAKLGAVTIMKHSDASAFTIPTEAVYQFDTTDPVHGIRTDIPNYLHFVLVDKTASSEIVHVHCSHDDGGA
ncbi:hypothetical protein V8V91_08510 [Algoriphagus halophilus]|uniref:hypothetical protein n=1 Tax=Algoriphagus halophilus TaxID=226505 RepID=UPI00358F6F6D